MSTIDPQLVAYCDEQAEAHLDELKSWIAIPSISANPAYTAEVQRCCDHLVGRLADIGLEARALPTKGNPIAYGEWLNAPGKPTVLIYGHYDVQPVDPLELWESLPFEADVRDGKIYGRGAVDDKGQVMMHFAAIAAHMQTRGKLPVNIKVVVEGEEEIGSPHFELALEKYRDLFQADLAVISDTAVFNEDTPSLTASMRGLATWEVTVIGPAGDLHSGYYGGIIRNPIEALAHIISELKDADGRIAAPGFYEGVHELEPKALSELRGLPFDEEIEAKNLGVGAFAGESGRLALERMWFRPTLECNGIWGGYQGPGRKTIIPSWAKAKLSARLVGDQDPAHVVRVVKEYIESVVPSGVKVLVEGSGDTRAVVIGREHPVIAAASRAMEAGFGKPPVFIGTGGTIGPVSSFDRILKLPQVMIGVGLPDDQIHAPNEKFNLKQFYSGIKTMASLYDELANI